MAKDLSFLPFFITEDLFILPQDGLAAASTQPTASQDTLSADASAVRKVPPAEAPVPAATKTAATASAEATPQPAPAASTAEKRAVNPKLIFGKNLKQLLVLVEDPANPVMERADGLLLKDILKAVGYNFDDVAIVNIAHCRGEADWKAIREIPFQRFFSFGVSHPEVPVTTTLAPYELEMSGDKKFLLTDKLSVLRSDRSRKIALWNLLKQIFV